ncbi:MAG: PASTA domain-containing protein [Nitrospirota bacterium]|nr:MAG: PASTA domain-containing protein [Nitrospirota bacterium]
MKGLLRNLIYFMIFSVTGVLVAIATFYVLTSTKSYDVPFLAGKSLLEANKILTDKNLYIKIDGESYDADIPSGHILKQDIPAGKKIKAGRRIGVIISKGPKILYTPMFSGLKLDDAEDIARQNNIRVENILKVHSDSVESNMVIAQDPNPEEHGSGGVSLIVSSGNYDELLICPPFKDMGIDEARAVAQQIGLDLSVRGKGRSIGSQSPAAFSLVKKGDLVKLELSDKESKWWF